MNDHGRQAPLTLGKRNVIGKIGPAQRLDEEKTQRRRAAFDGSGRKLAKLLLSRSGFLGRQVPINNSSSFLIDRTPILLLLARRNLSAGVIFAIKYNSEMPFLSFFSASW
jgi:hypothetical protein